MRPELVAQGTGARGRGDLSRFTSVALDACRGITLRQWLWTTAIALLIALAGSIGLLPPLLNAVPSLVGKQPADVSIAKFVGWTALFLVAAYSLLLAVSIEVRDDQVVNDVE